MKRTNPIPRQAYFFLFTLSFFLITACPDPPETADCGAHQVKVNGDCECEQGYLWNEGQTKCLMDTTSHNFVWELDTLGIYPSYLYDVAVINENNIWVVGMIKTDEPDTVYNLPYTTYNAAQWDGNGWELYRIAPEGYFGPITSIFALSDNDLWFGKYGLPIHFDGESFIKYSPNNGGHPGQPTINAIWGTSSSNIYFIGNNGSIVHYDGSNFTLMESGTDVDLLDIVGTPDGEYVFVVGWDATLPAPCVVLEFTNGIWNTLYYTEGSLPSNGNVGWVWGVGVMHDTAYFPTSTGLWKYNFTNQDSILIPNLISHMNQSAFKNVNIKSTNDIFFGGAGFKYIHFNGSTYYYSQEITDMYPQRAMLGSDYKNNLAVMVGYFNWWEGALVAKGYHE